MNKLLSLLALMVFTFNASAQQHNIWYFGDSAGIDFNSGSAAVINNGSLLSYDNSSTICDSNGNLLFYTNGETVWNKNHAVMHNGTGLMGSNNSTHGSTIIKKPNSNIYYLFTTPDFAGSSGFRYSTIDMSMQNGLGQVSSKNNLLIGPVSEKCVSILHQNGTDIWVITHLWNSNKFYAYLIDSNGVNTTPVVTSIGATHSGGTQGTYNSMGQITATYSGNKIALAVYDLGIFEIYNFNKSTGQISNLVTLSGFSKAWGVEFSYNEQFLYATEWANNKIYQFDISSGIDSVILNSNQVVGIGTGPHSLYKVGFMSLGPDKKIYVAKFEDHFVGRIDYPDSSGIACNYEDSALNLGSKICYAGLSSVNKNYMFDTISCNLSMNVYQLVNTLTTSTPAQNYFWYDCSINSLVVNANSNVFIPNASGSYAVIGESNNCRDTSDCFNFVLTDVSEHSLDSEIYLYPNPVFHELNIQYTGIESTATELIYNLFDGGGHLIRSGVMKQNYSVIDVSSMSTGRYYIQFITKGEVIHKSFVKSY